MHLDRMPTPSDECPPVTYSLLSSQGDSISTNGFWLNPPTGCSFDRIVESMIGCSTVRVMSESPTIRASL